MFASGRPLLHGSSSGGIICATPCASGPKRSFPAASSASAGPYSCPLRHATSSRLLDGGCWTPRSAAGANSPSAVESNASTLAGTALLTAQGLVNSYNGASRPTHVIDLPGSATATGHRDQAEPFLSWEHTDPQELAHTLDVRVPSAASASTSLAPPDDSVNGVSPSHTAEPALAHQQQQQQHTVSVAGGAATAAASSRSAEAGSLGSAHAAASQAAAVNGGWTPEDAPRPLPADSDAPQPEASTSAPAEATTRQRRKGATGRRAGSAAAAAASLSSTDAVADAAAGVGGGSNGAEAAVAAATVVRRGRGRPRSTTAPTTPPEALGSAQQDQPPAEAEAIDAEDVDGSGSQSALQRTRQLEPNQSQLQPQQQQQQARRGPPPRPRLKPPPPPQSWPDYPYTRRAAASAVTPGDEAAAKLEALFQCVLHAPRLPARLLRFLRRSVPGGPAAALPLVTESVEGLSDVLGREVRDEGRGGKGKGREGGVWDKGCASESCGAGPGVNAGTAWHASIDSQECPGTRVSFSSSRVQLGCSSVAAQP